jgi:hypothetical protein
MVPYLHTQIYNFAQHNATYFGPRLFTVEVEVYPIYNAEHNATYAASQKFPVTCTKTVAAVTEVLG